jgi:FkbM family methyltransferase
MTFYSQFGEDQFINLLLPKTDGICIEVGADDGITGSNTYYFEQKGWDCLCIEPIPSTYDKCSKNRKKCLKYAIGEFDTFQNFSIVNLNNDNTSAISSLSIDNRLIESHKHMITNISEIIVEVRSLNSLLAELNYPTDIDFISIDTENTELNVLKGLDLLKYNVKLFVIENNFNEPFIQDYLKQFGYQLIKRTGVNDFYIKQKIFEEDSYNIFHGEFHGTNQIDTTLKSFFPKNYKGVFVEIGAYEPIFINNSYHFEKNGWDCHCFEANPNLIPLLKEHRKNVYNYAISDKNNGIIDFNVVQLDSGYTCSYSAINLDNDIIEKFNKKMIDKINKTFQVQVEEKRLDSFNFDKIDILCVDVEGGELNVLKGMGCKPSIICIENLSNDDSIYNFLKDEYILIKKDEYDEYYHHKSFFNWGFYLSFYEDLLKAGINTPEAAWNHWINYGRNEGRITNNLI